MENVIKCEITLDKIFYPKYVNHVDSGEYAIFAGTVRKTLEGEVLKKIKLKGNVPKLLYGATYKVYAELVETNATYGDTYEIMYMSKKIDISSKEKQKEFLSNILPDTQVEGLFEMYDDVIKLLEDKDVEALCKVKGIKSQSALKILDSYEDSKDYSNIYIELGKLGLSSNLIKKLMDFYKSPDTVVDIIRNNPYDLVRLSGIGFKKADEIAQKVGIDKYDIKRIRGFLTHVLIEQGELGRSYLMYQELMKTMYDTLGFIPDEIVRNVARIMVEKKDVVLSDDCERIALKKYYDLEQNIKLEIDRLKIGEREKEELDESGIYTRYVPMEFNFDNVEETITEIENKQGFEFTDEQREGILLAKSENVIVITGGAGCGKTSTANGMLKLLPNANVASCALSGKAAVRITEATGLEASTIHRLLQYQPDGTFFHDSEHTLCVDVIVIDEATMINGSLFLSLLKAIPSGAKVIIMGDVQQLTPIGNCQVFADLLASGKVAKITLTKPHRQALRSGIIPLSMNIAKQKPIFNNGWTGVEVLGELQDMELSIHDKDNKLDELILTYFQREIDKVKNVMEVQICTPMRIRGDLSCYNLNNKIQNVYNPISNYNGNIITIVLDGKDKQDIKKYVITVGDKVINVVNNYKAVTTDGKRCPVFNGNIGIVKSIDEDGSCVVNFEGIGELLLSKKEVKNLELAYALTTHKCQGSGFDSVIVALDGASYIMNNSELLYTGITRAKKYCVLIGDTGVIKKTITTKEVNKKQTFLKEML